jgi:hypothetical protein
MVPAVMIQGDTIMKTSIRNLGIRPWLIGLLLTPLVPGALHAQGGPTLVASVPANGASGVALDSKITFTFSAAMKAQESVTWSGLDPNSVTYAWSADAKTLTCSYSGNLPSATTISWFLSPSFPPFLLGFEDSAGTPLSGFPVGAFNTTGGGGGTNDCSGSSGNGMFTSYSLFKSAMYVEDSAAAPAPDTSSDPFTFSASVNLATNRTATSATLTVPGSSPQPMSSFFAGSYFLVGATNDLSKLDALYPPGNYTFVVSGSPNQTVVANLPANVLPNAPHLSNYAAAKTINAGADFTLTWDAFVGGRTNDSIGVEVLNSLQQRVFEITNSAGCPSVLPGTATSIDIPAGTLASNQTYTAQISFQKNAGFDTNSYPGSVVFVAGQSITTATMGTGSGSALPPAPVFTNITSLANAQISFQLQTQAGYLYVIEFNSDLGNANGWTQLLSSNALGSVIQVKDTVSAGGAARFYRARAN